MSPAAPDLTTTPGGLRERAMARILDYLVLTILTTAVLRAILEGRTFRTGFTTWLIVAGLLLLSVLIQIGYAAGMEAWRGQTLGKMLFRLHVQQEHSTAPPTFAQALRRNVIYGADLLRIIPALGLLLSLAGQAGAAVTIAMNINDDPVHRRGWHDRLAGGTRVVRIR